MTIRAFRWDDLALLADLQTRVSGPGQGDASVKPEELRLWLSIPTLRPEENCFLAFEDSVPTGYLQVVPEQPIDRVVLEGGVRSDYRRRGIGQRLFQRGVDRARELGVSRVHASAQDSATEERSFLASQGMQEVRRYRRMRRGPEPIATSEPPRGIVLERLRPGEEATLARVQNAAFSGSWGFAPNTPEDIASRLRLPGCSPEGVVPARKDDGEVVAYCWTRIEERSEDITGAIWMIGVLPDQQGSGLGRLVLEAGLRHLLAQRVWRIELDVDEANTGARRLYASEGFQDAYAIHWYELTLI